MIMTEEREKDISNLKLEGEGSREGSRRFQKAQHDFAQNGDVESKAREAALALDGDEAEDLERARRAAEKAKYASD
jgi:hypothetical protein